MQHHAPHRLDQLADRGVIAAVLIDRNHDEAAELVLAPVLENCRCQRAGETDHHDGADLLLERHARRAQERILVSPAGSWLRGWRCREFERGLGRTTLRRRYHTR